MPKRKQDKSKPSRRRKKKRRVYFEATQLRELLGQINDVAFELQRTASFNKPISDADTCVNERVSHQPDIDETPEHRQRNPSRRFKRYWATLTRAQKEAMRRVYIKNPERHSKAEIARQIGIRVETLQERIDYAIKKLKEHFPEIQN